MSHYAITLQQAALTRLKFAFGDTFKTYRQTPMLQVHAPDLPILAVHILRERRIPDGQANQAEPKFVHDLTLGFSGAVHMETDQQDAIHDLETWMATIDDILLSDPTFTRMCGGVTSMDRVGQYAKIGEVTLFEIRVEMVFQFGSNFEPRIYDQLATVDIKSVEPDGTPLVEMLIHMAAAKRAEILKRANGSRKP